MALNWSWDNKIGELLINQDGKEFTISIYQGNALAIFISEFTNQEGVEQYSLYNFFCDKEHFKRCTQDKTNNYAREWRKMTLWKVPNDFWIILKDLVKRGVNIEIRSKDDVQN